MKNLFEAQPSLKPISNQMPEVYRSKFEQVALLFALAEQIEEQQLLSLAEISTSLEQAA